MPHISVPEGLPGLVGLMAFKPATGARIADLIHQLLHGDSPLSNTERELITAYVSTLNNPEECPHDSAASARRAEAASEGGLAAEEIDPRLQALLRLAAAVVAGGPCVTEEHIAAARAAGSNDEEIHDTVLLAATYCMLSRYVDGLAIAVGHDEDHGSDEMSDQLSERPYRPA